MSGPGVLDFRIGEVRFQMLTLDPDFEPNKEELYLRHQHQCFELHYVYRGKCVFGIRDGECCVQTVSYTHLFFPYSFFIHCVILSLGIYRKEENVMGLKTDSICCLLYTSRGVPDVHTSRISCLEDCDPAFAGAGDSGSFL